MIKILDKTKGSYKVQVNKHVFYVTKSDQHINRIELSVLECETKFKRYYKILGTFKNHMDCLNYLRELEKQEQKAA